MAIRNIVKNELIELGYNISHKGTLYLIETLIIICNSKNHF